MANRVHFFNNGGFVCNFSVQWDGGESLRTPELSNQQSAEIDLTTLTNLKPNTVCWVRAYIVAGVNHDSGRNFTYDSNTTVEYTLSGTTINPSFD
jgi:hypothetical protein